MRTRTESFLEKYEESEKVKYIDNKTCCCYTFSYCWFYCCLPYNYLYGY